MSYPLPLAMLPQVARDGAGKLRADVLYAYLQQGYTLSDLGAQLGLTRERIRQVVANAGYVARTGLAERTARRRVDRLAPAEQAVALAFRRHGWRVVLQQGRTRTLGVEHDGALWTLRIHRATPTRIGGALYYRTCAWTSGAHERHLAHVPGRGWYVLPTSRTHGIQIPLRPRRGYWLRQRPVSLESAADLARIFDAPEPFPHYRRGERRRAA